MVCDSRRPGATSSQELRPRAKTTAPRSRQPRAQTTALDPYLGAHANVPAVGVAANHHKLIREIGPNQLTARREEKGGGVHKNQSL